MKLLKLLLASGILCTQLHAAEIPNKKDAANQALIESYWMYDHGHSNPDYTAINLSAMQKALEDGARPSTRCSKMLGDPIILVRTIENGDLQLLKILLSFVSKEDLECDSGAPLREAVHEAVAPYPWRNKNGTSKLVLTSVLEQYKKHGASLNEREPVAKFGFRTPFWCAAMMNKPDVMELLLDYKADPSGRPTQGWQDKNQDTYKSAMVLRDTVLAKRQS